jgi:hypothetical protein
MRSGRYRIMIIVACGLAIFLVPFPLIYFIPLERIDFERTAAVVSVGGGCVSLLALALHLRSPGPAPARTVTITIEDSEGRYARIHGRSDRQVREIMCDVHQLLARVPAEP